MTDLKQWRYEIRYGPDGEDAYSWVYDDEGGMVATMKTHKAKEVVDRMNTRLSAPVERLELYNEACEYNYEDGYPYAYMVPHPNGQYVPRANAEAYAAGLVARIAELEDECNELVKTSNEVIQQRDLALNSCALAEERAETAEAELAKKEEERAEQWRLRRDAEGSRDAVFAANDTLRAELAKAREALKEIANSAHFLTGDGHAFCAEIARAALKPGDV